MKRFDDFELYVLTEKGRDFFPAYLALKKWGDDWLADGAGPQVVFRERALGRPIEYPEMKRADEELLGLEDIEVVAGAGAVPFNRLRFGALRPNTARIRPKRKAQVDPSPTSRERAIGGSRRGAWSAGG